MKYTVEISRRANVDLRGIYEYIAFELESQQTAIEQLSRLEKGIMLLGTFPERYRKLENKYWQGSELHIMPIDNYVVLYSVDNDKKKVFVVRVLYSGRNI